MDSFPSASRYPVALLILSALLLGGICHGETAGQAWITLETEAATFGIDRRGSLCELARNQDGRSYLAANQPAPLLQLRIEGKFIAPQANASAVIHIQTKPTHIVLKLVDAQPRNRIELILWGPYPTTIGDIIGETVGVARDKEFANRHPGAQRQDSGRLSRP